MKFEVIESRAWRHVSGATASIYGAAPWTTAADKDNWTIEARGWTVRNPHTGQVGACRQPFATRDEAQAYADRVTPSRIGYGD
jgi:hypothetical protein